MGLDKTDMKILAELDLNARQSNSDIARRVRVNKNTLAYRINNLEKNGIIRGYYAVIDSSKLGFVSFRLYLKLKHATPQTEKEILQFLLNEKGTFWVGTIKGKFNMVCIYWVKTHGEFVDFVDRLLLKYRKYIVDYKINLYYKLWHYKLPFTKQYAKDKASVEVVGGDERTEIDDTDYAILKVLAANARVPLLEIAKNVNLTPGAVKYRLKRLEREGVIKGYRVIVDMEKLNYTHYKADFNLLDMSKHGEMEKFARNHPNIFYLNKTVGWYDYEIEIYAQSPREFFDIIDEIREKFGENIVDYDHFTISRIEKLLYIPEK